MRIRKSVVFGVPVVMVTTLVAVLALWAWAPIDVGSTSNAGLTWNVEYWHRNAEGEVLQHKKESNAIVASGLEHAMERLIAEADADASLAFADPGAVAEIGVANAFDQIVLLNVDDAASDGILLGSVLTNVDGTNNADAVHMNPADGTYANVGSATDGDGSVAVTFLAQGDPAQAEQMHLVKAPFDDTVGGALAIAADDVLATIEIVVDLADTDTLTVTWTINVS